MKANRGIVSLTYDGTQLCHVETVLPDLADAGLTGTFYAEPSTLLDHYPAWRFAQGRGNEIGNGSLICAALPDGSLPSWSIEMILDDLGEANQLLDELFPDQRGISVGLPIGRATTGKISDYLSAIQPLFPVIRTGNLGVNPALSQSANQLKVIDPSNLTGPQLAQIARQAIQGPTWIVFAFDGVGSGSRSIDQKAHRTLLEFLKQNHDLLQILPVIDAATRLTSSESPVKLV